MRHLAFAFLGLLLLGSSSIAQPKAYGLRAGLAAISNSEGNHALIEAFYDVPMGDILFSPELVVITAQSPEPAYGLNIKFRRQLTSLLPLDQQVHRWAIVGDVGAQFMVWDTITTSGGPPKRAHFGIPIDLSAEIPTGGLTQFEVTLSYTPMFFLGADAYYRSLFAVLAGIRILVP